MSPLSLSTPIFAPSASSSSFRLFQDADESESVELFYVVHRLSSDVTIMKHNHAVTATATRFNNLP